MDLNQLYFSHQVLAMRTAEIPDSVVRRDSESVASTIAGRLGCIQRALGARAASGWELLALPDRNDLTGRSFGARSDWPAPAPAAQVMTLRSVVANLLARLPMPVPWSQAKIRIEVMQGLRRGRKRRPSSRSVQAALNVRMPPG